MTVPDTIRQVTTPKDAGAPAQARLEPSGDGVLVVRLVGAWRMGRARPPPQEFEHALEAQGARRVALDASEVESWDTALLTWVTTVLAICRARGVEVDRSRLPPGIGRLIQLSEAVPERVVSQKPPRPSFVARIGIASSRAWKGVLDVLAFLGRIVPALRRFVTFRAQFRTSDLMLLIQDAGVQALPIVTLVSIIVGLILAFVGAVQLSLFGADLYVANLVAIAMVREMGAMVVGIIMAGRTGAAYAAQLGTMKVTEEIDALTTFGISAIDFLVLPRLVALFVMMPFLCLYSILLGILGGGIVGVGMLGISPELYLDQTLSALSMTDLWGGLFRGAVYGVLVAVIGCLRGMQSGSSAAAVGAATTSAVVTTLVMIVVADGVLAVLFNLLGI